MIFRLWQNIILVFCFGFFRVCDCFSKVSGLAHGDLDIMDLRLFPKDYDAQEEAIIPTTPFMCLLSVIRNVKAENFQNPR